MVKDIVKFGPVSFKVATGYTEADIREALVEQAPAAAQAKLVKTDNGDGSFTWTFTEVAGVKG